MVLQHSYVQPDYLWTRLGDEQGRPVFVKDEVLAKGAPDCDEACNAQFAPLYAGAKARAFGDWSLIEAERGKKQWSYKGQALYRHAPSNDLFLSPPANYDNGVEPGGLPADKDGTNILTKKYSPAKGWRIAAYEPASLAVLPEGMRIEQVVSANAFALVSADGRTIYTADRPDLACSGQGTCYSDWQPLRAPRLGAPTGDFSIVRGVDGSPQWAFRGKALFRFKGDYAPGEANGVGLLPGLTVAAVSHHYMPAGVQIRQAPGRGPILTTTEGAALYSRHLYEYWWGGRNSYNGFRTTYHRGKQLGTKGCNAECLKEWRPLKAAKNAQASGYWEIATREDGSRQWAYRGHALYTYVGDQKPGQVNGSNLYDIVVGDVGRYSMAEVGGGRESGAGLFWHVTHPY